MVKLKRQREITQHKDERQNKDVSRNIRKGMKKPQIKRKQRY